MVPALILADLGGVVVDIDPGRCHRGWADLSSLTSDEVAARLFPDAQYEALERGHVTVQAYLEHVRDQLGSNAELEALAACFNDIYLGLNREVLQVLDERRSAGWRLAALTNTNQLHHDRWWPMYRDALTMFERIHLSHELGARKPEPACFEAVLELEGVPPEEVVFVDDAEEHVTAARSLGIEAIHFTSADQLARDLGQLDDRGS